MNQCHLLPARLFVQLIDMLSIPVIGGKLQAKALQYHRNITATRSVLDFGRHEIAFVRSCATCNLALASALPHRLGLPEAILAVVVVVVTRVELSFKLSPILSFLSCHRYLRTYPFATLCKLLAVDSVGDASMASIARPPESDRPPLRPLFF